MAGQKYRSPFKDITHRHQEEYERAVGEEYKQIGWKMDISKESYFQTPRVLNPNKNNNKKNEGAEESTADRTHIPRISPLEVSGLRKVYKEDSGESGRRNLALEFFRGNGREGEGEGGKVEGGKVEGGNGEGGKGEGGKGAKRRGRTTAPVFFDIRDTRGKRHRELITGGGHPRSISPFYLNPLTHNIEHVNSERVDYVEYTDTPQFPFSGHPHPQDEDDLVHIPLKDREIISISSGILDNPRDSQEPSLSDNYTNSFGRFIQSKGTLATPTDTTDTTTDSGMNTSCFSSTTFSNGLTGDTTQQIREFNLRLQHKRKLKIGMGLERNREESKALPLPKYMEKKRTTGMFAYSEAGNELISNNIYIIYIGDDIYSSKKIKVGQKETANISSVGLQNPQTNQTEYYRLYSDKDVGFDLSFQKQIKECVIILIYIYIFIY